MRKVVMILSILTFSFACFAENSSTEKAIDFQFALYKKVPLKSEKVEEILKKRILKIDNKKLFGNGYKYSYSELSKETQLNRKGFLKIYNNKTEYDEINSFVIRGNESNSNVYIEIIPKNKKKENSESCDILNIDRTFVKSHKVELNKIVEFKDSDLEENVFSMVKEYSKTNPKLIYLFNAGGEYEADGITKLEITKNYDIRLSKFENIEYESFYIADFVYKVKDFRENISFLIGNKKIDRVGLFHDFISFKIDNILYLSFSHQVEPGSGYLGKELYKYENGSLNTVTTDYTFAD